MEVSLCILACGQVEGTKRLIESVREFPSLDVEVVIGDNSPLEEDREAFIKLADTHLVIEDSDLWFNGFGACKQKIATAANNDWIFIGDPDELWEPATSNRAFQWNTVLRTELVEDGKVVTTHGRVFDRRHWRLMGMIHEELYHKRHRDNWGQWATTQPFAKVYHTPSEDKRYEARKRALYHSLLSRIAENPLISAGTSSWWWLEYWPKHKDGIELLSFDKWRERYGKAGPE